MLVPIEKIYRTLKNVLVHIKIKNTSKFVKTSPLRDVFLTLFSVFGNVVKHGLSFLIYYIKYGAVVKSMLTAHIW